MLGLDGVRLTEILLKIYGVAGRDAGAPGENILLNFFVVTGLAAQVAGFKLFLAEKSFSKIVV